jgi:putative protease
MSLHDLNLSEDLPSLLDAGVSSFKIEGRLKDRAYVANVVAHYSDRLDAAMRERGLRRSSSGTSRSGFTPNLNKTFNRGHTRYFLRGRTAKIGRPSTPKMIGEEVGRVTRVSGSEVAVAARLDLAPGDGLCFFDPTGTLQGTLVNAVSSKTVTVQSAKGIRTGTHLYRNRDHAFLRAIDDTRMERRIAVTLRLRAAFDGVSLAAVDEDGVAVEHRVSCRLEPARDLEASLGTIRRQLAKTGQSSYTCAGVFVEVSPVPFFAVSVLNALRRETLELLTFERERRRPRVTGGAIKNEAPYPASELTYLGNVLNDRAEAFYRRHGVTKIQRAAESGVDLRGRKVMTTRYCLMHQLDLCRETGVDGSVEQPLYLVDDGGTRLRLDIDCSRCEMDVTLV